MDQIADEIVDETINEFLFLLKNGEKKTQFNAPIRDDYIILII